MLLLTAISCANPPPTQPLRHLGEVIEELAGKGVKINGAAALAPGARDIGGRGRQRENGKHENI
jgi:hypothetical protein